jgi:hypothetical protein
MTDPSGFTDLERFTRALFRVKKTSLEKNVSIVQRPQDARELNDESAPSGEPFDPV